MIEDILRQIGHRPLMDVRPFLNGDTLLEYRIHEICHMIKKYTGAKIVTFTNGTIYENKKLLKDINLDEVHFTVSAGTRKTYEKVTGHDLFNEAAKTIKWFETNKYPNQNTVIHMVLVNDNIHEVKQFKEKFKNFQQIISPITLSFSNQPAKNATVGLDISKQHDVGTHKGEMHGMPCVLYNNLSIDWRGYILQCCNWCDPKVWNYGKIGETSLDEAWEKRQKNNLDNILCNSCNMKAKNWRDILASWD